MSSTVEQITKMLSITDGRDKTYKFLQGATKALGYYSADPATASKFNKLSQSIGEGRSIMRLGKWTSNIQKIDALNQKAIKKGAWNQLLVIELLRVLGDMGYVIGDNTTYLSKYRILPADPKLATKYAKISQFWGFFCQIILDIVTIMGLDAAKPTYAAERETALQNITKNTADILVILATVGYLPKSIYNINAGLAGILVALSGAIATYQNWTKAAPKPEEKKKE
jgi:hypothetical protein